MKLIMMATTLIPMTIMMTIDIPLSPLLDKVHRRLQHNHRNLPLQVIRQSTDSGSGAAADYQLSWLGISVAGAVALGGFLIQYIIISQVKLTILHRELKKIVAIIGKVAKICIYSEISFYLYAIFRYFSILDCLAITLVYSTIYSRLTFIFCQL